MQTSKLRPLYHLVKLNNSRTTVVDATVTNEAQQLKSWREVPGPARLPIIGQAYHFFPGGELHNLNAEQFGTQLYKLYGPIVRFDGALGKPPLMFLFDPEHCAQVLRSENWFPIRPTLESLDYYRQDYSRADKNATKSNFNGLATDQGDLWKQFRSTVNPVLMQPKTIRLYTDMIDQVAQDMITRLKSLRGTDNKINGDFEIEMNLWALESVALVALGRRLKCFDSQLPPDSPEKRLINVVHEIFKVADALDFKPSLWKYYPTKTFKKAMKLYEEQENLTRYFIGKTIEELDKREGTIPDEQKSVLEKLLEINKDVAYIMASDLLFAGVDTTSNSITATLFLLANNQEKQDKLRDEIRSTPDFNEKRPYLKACLKESIRMMPVTTGNTRLTTKEYEMFGYKIPVGIKIIFMHQHMSSMEDQFPRAKEYLPERWLVKKDDPLNYRSAHPFAYQPFGFGTRSCIGRRIAQLEMETFLARLIENFKVEWCGPPVNTRQATINYVMGPYNFILKDA